MVRALGPSGYSAGVSNFSLLFFFPPALLFLSEKQRLAIHHVLIHSGTEASQLPRRRCDISANQRISALRGRQIHRHITRAFRTLQRFSICPKQLKTWSKLLHFTVLLPLFPAQLPLSEITTPSSPRQFSSRREEAAFLVWNLAEARRILFTALDTSTRFDLLTLNKASLRDAVAVLWRVFPLEKYEDVMKCGIPLVRTSSGANGDEGSLTVSSV